MEDKTLLKVDMCKTIDNLTESIEKCTEHQNKLWQGVLRLVITLSSSLLIVTIILVEKIFNEYFSPIFPNQAEFQFSSLSNNFSDKTNNY